MKKITGNTRLLGVIGWPIEHSLSPIMHNAALCSMGLDYSYMALPCEEKNLSSVIKTLRKIGCAGLNITIPHKTKVLNLCKTIDQNAKSIGAINTLSPIEDCNWAGSNTDIEGFISPLKEKINLAGKKALVLGCGGSARAIMSGLKKLKVQEINVVGRNTIKLRSFILEQRDNQCDINRLKIDGIDWNSPILTEYINSSNIIINTTPIGMKMKNKNNHDSIPINKDIWSGLKSHQLLYDIIYNPKTTSWLKIGQNLGCQTINGLEMLVEQGAASLRLWTQTNDIPLEIMKKAIEENL